MNALKFIGALAVNIALAIGNILILAVALPVLVVMKTIDEVKERCEQ